MIIDNYWEVAVYVVGIFGIGHFAGMCTAALIYWQSTTRESTERKGTKRAAHRTSTSDAKTDQRPYSS